LRTSDTLETPAPNSIIGQDFMHPTRPAATPACAALSQRSLELGSGLFGGAIMPRWTNWRFIATFRKWVDDHLDHDGPAVYELGIKYRGSRTVETMYVGETS